MVMNTSKVFLFEKSKLFLGVKLARPKTIFWYKEKGFRTDILFGFVRTFCRSEQVYMYKLYIGRLGIVFGRYSNPKGYNNCN